MMKICLREKTIAEKNLLGLGKTVLGKNPPGKTTPEPKPNPITLPLAPHGELFSGAILHNKTIRHSKI